MEHFNKQEYRRKLIESGVDPEQATEVALRTADAHRNRPANTDARSIGSLVALPAVIGSPAPASAFELEHGNHTEAKQVVLTTKSEAMKAKKPAKPAATEALTAKVEKAKQGALLKHTKQQAKDSQFSLFDIAPWADNMRALPNDYARSALFTVRNKRVPRAALQNHPIYHVHRHRTARRG